MRTQHPKAPRSVTRRFLRALGRLARGEKGAVFTEAVIMIPFFLLLWGAIIWCHQYYFARIQLSSRTKGCSWYYAVHACEGAMPAGCEGLTPTAGTPFSPSGSGHTSALDSFASTSPFSTMLAGVFGHDTDVNGSTSLTRPTVLGGGSVNASWSNSVMCGTKPQTPAHFFGQIFSSFLTWH